MQPVNPHLLTVQIPIPKTPFELKVLVIPHRSYTPSLRKSGHFYEIWLAPQARTVETPFLSVEEKTGKATLFRLRAADKNMRIYLELAPEAGPR